MFSFHLRMAADKTTRVMNFLSGLMPNVKGLSERKRRLLSSVVQSVFLYSAPSWASSLVNNVSEHRHSGTHSVTGSHLVCGGLPYGVV